MRAVVVGGGISGLAAGWALVEAGAEAVTVLEADERFGGKIRTTPFDGQPVDEGPDAFLARVPHAVALARALGLGDELVSPGTGAASLWLDGVLKPIPPGLVLGVPVDFEPLAASGVLSDEGVERARQEPSLPGLPLTEDVTIGDLVRARYGPEVHERLVDPLLGGINAGRTEELSLDVGAAQLAAVARQASSLTEGLQAQRAANPPDPSAPVFYAPRAGVGALVDALVSALTRAGADLRLDTTVTTIERRADRWLVLTGDAGSSGPQAGATSARPHDTDASSVHDADVLVITTPAFAAAPLLAPHSPAAAERLEGIGYSSVSLVTLAYDDTAVTRPIQGSGFLVPRTEGRLLTACSVFSNKWPQLARPGSVILRASVGRHGDERAFELDDDALVDAVHDELTEVLGLTAGPTASRVSRWHRSFPQFPAGHLTNMAELQQRLAVDAPGIAVTGAYLTGVGIPACIGAAQAAVARLVTRP